MVDSAVAVKHFIGVHAMRKCDELMSQTDTENGLARLDNFGYLFNRLGQRLWVARSVRQEISVRIKAVELLFGAVVWKYFDITISFCQTSQYVCFDTKIHRSNFVSRIFLSEEIRFFGRNF